MKTLCLLIISLLVYSHLAGQYCGESSPIACPVNYFPFDTAVAYDGNLDSLPCIIRGQPYYHRVTIRTGPFTATFNGQTVVFHIDSIRVFDLDPLPTGLCWTTSEADNFVAYPDYICLAITGTTYDSAGLYGFWGPDFYMHPTPSMIPEIPPHPLQVINSGANCATFLTTSVLKPQRAAVSISLSSGDILLKDCYAAGMLRVYDLSGQLLLQEQVSQSNCSFHFPYSAGLYLANLQLGNNSETFKLIKPTD